MSQPLFNGLIEATDRQIDALVLRALRADGREIGIVDGAGSKNLFSKGDEG